MKKLPLSKTEGGALGEKTHPCENQNRKDGPPAGSWPAVAVPELASGRNLTNRSDNLLVGLGRWI